VCERSGVTRYHDYLRWLYKGGRPNGFAKLQNRASAAVFARGVFPRRVASLEVKGRKSGRAVTLPIVIADLAGERYVVSMLGEAAHWVQHVRADHGRAVLRHGSSEAITLTEVDVSERAPILRRYLEVAPGARPHIPVERAAPIEEFERVADDFPVFRIVTRDPDPSSG
jgi:hypothetical protein